MTKRVLVPVDESPRADAALDHAIEEFGDATLIALTVIDPAAVGHTASAALPTFPEQWFEQRKEEAEELLAAVRERAAEADGAIETDHEVGKPATTIVEYAEEHDCDHIVLGSHGRTGVTRILLGSTAETVVRRSPVPVTVVR